LQSKSEYITDEMDWNCDTLLSPILVNYSDYEANKNRALFYSKVKLEGVRLIT